MKHNLIAIVAVLVVAAGTVTSCSTESRDSAKAFRELDNILAEQEMRVYKASQQYEEIEAALQTIQDGHVRDIFRNYVKDKAFDTILLNYRKAKIDSAELVYGVQNRLCELYTEFRNDKAREYATANIALARELGDSARVVDNKLVLMRLLNKCYLLDESSALAESLDTTAMTGDQRLFYYRNLADIYLFKVEFHKGNSYEKEYQQQLTYYRHMIAQMAPEGSSTQVIYRANYLNDVDSTGEAIALIEDLLKRYSPGERNYSVLTSTLAFYYSCLGQRKAIPPYSCEIIPEDDKKKNTFREKQKQLLAHSAASDLQGLIMENSALRQLSQLLFEDGDIDRAYRYINQSISDANYYGTRLRNVQASQLLPQIIAAYQLKQESDYNKVKRLNTVLALLAVLLAAGIAAMAWLYRRVRRLSADLSATNDTLSDTVEQLEQTNARLTERDKIKEQYLSRFLALSSSLIDSSEKQRKQLGKLAMDERHKELLAKLKSTDAYDANTRLFYHHFDEAFLNIYPTFISGVNSLLYPHEKIVPKQNERLTRELRILALLRLGIDDNHEIATILRSSISTVYTYRSRLKARAINKATFEEEIRTLQ